MECQSERMNSTNAPSLHSLKRPVVLNDDVYALGRDLAGNGKLCKYSLTSNEWSVFSMSQSVYATHSVLTTYRSKLLLISGKDRTIFEFSIKDFVFNETSIQPFPRTKRAVHTYDFMATSNNDYLIVMDCSYRVAPIRSLSVFDGNSWKSRLCEMNMGFPPSAYRLDNMISEHVAVIVAHSNWGNEVRFFKAPLILGEGDDSSDIEFKEVDVISYEEFDKLVCRRGCATVLHNDNVYFADSHGVVFTAFIQPPIVPIVWGNSGNEFQQVPHVVGLSDGTLLLIGTTAEEKGSTLDVIKVKQQGMYSYYFKY